MLTCPQCLKPIKDFVAQMKELEGMWEGAMFTSDRGIFANIWCKNCNNMTIGMDIYANDTAEIVKDPQGREVIINMPSGKKKVKN